MPRHIARASQSVTANRQSRNVVYSATAIARLTALHRTWSIGLSAEMRMPIVRLLMLAFVWALPSGCACRGPASAADSPGPTERRYFASPRQAVEQIDAMLRCEQWSELASYYDLSDSPIDPSDLT